MSETRFNDVYNFDCRKLGRELQKRNLALWQDIQATIVGDDSFAWIIPAEKIEEAKRRHTFVDNVLKKYNKYFYSRNIKVYTFIHNLNKRLKKIEQNEGQLCLFDDFEEKAKAEKCEIIEIKKMIRDMKGYFTFTHIV